MPGPDAGASHHRGGTAPVPPKEGCPRCDLRCMAGTVPELPVRHRVRRAGADSPSAPGKQAKFEEGTGPARTVPRRRIRNSPGGGRGTGNGHEPPAGGIPSPAGPAARYRPPNAGGPGGPDALLSPARPQKRKEGPLSESLHLSDQSGMRITSWIYAHRAVRRAGPCCGSRYGRCRTGA